MNIAKEEDEVVKASGSQPEVIPIDVAEAPEQLKKDDSEGQKQSMDDKSDNLNVNDKAAERLNVDGGDETSAHLVLPHQVPRPEDDGESGTSEDESQYDDEDESQYDDDRSSTTTKESDVVDEQNDGESDVHEDQPLSSQNSGADAKTGGGQEFGETFDEFFKTFLATESSQLDDREIRSFTQKVPKGFKVEENRYETMFQALFKVKEIQNKAVYNDSLALLREFFTNLDFNKFLVKFWNCETFKNRELGPIGYSFTSDTAKYDFTGVQPNNNDITLINAKAIDAAWSICLDLDASLKKMLDTYMTDKPMSVFYLIILRRFKCLGDYKLNLDGKETPIFLYYLRNLINGLDGHQLNIALSCLVSVCWSPKGHYCYSALKPIFALREIMNRLVCDDEHHTSYMLALRRLFTPIPGFRCDIEWNEESKDFDNQSLFLFHFIKYYNRKQSISNNTDVFFIITCFQKSMKFFGRKVTKLGALENVEIDWPFAYRILNFLDVHDVKRPISESIYKALPEADVDKYIALDESEPSLENALTGLTELYLLSDDNHQIPDAFYRNLWNTHAHPKSIIDLFARSIISAYQNLKSSVKIEIDKKLVDFVNRISQFCINYDLVEAFSCATELNFDFISRSTHLVIIGRTLRLIIENQYNKDKRRLAFRDLPEFFFDLFRIFAMKTRDKFSDIRTINQGLWPPWRKGAAGCMDDEKAMAINHFLNSIQKEAFCMYDCTVGHSQEFLEFLFFLHRQRKYHGINHPKVEEALRANFSNYFDHGESGGNVDRSPRHESGQLHNRAQQENRPQQSPQHFDRGRNHGPSMNNGQQERNRGPLGNQLQHGEQNRDRGTQSGGRGGSNSFNTHPQFAPGRMFSSTRGSRGGRGGSSAA